LEKLECLCTQDAKDQGRSDQRGGSQVLEAWVPGRKSEFVFYNLETGKPLVDLKSGFGRACRKPGIDGVSWHTLRHTFASRLVNRGVDIVTVQQLLGHSAVTVTMRYTNLDSKHAAVAKLEGFGDNDSVHQNAAIEGRDCHQMQL
jgi:integrase